MTLADHLERFARDHGLEAPDTTKLRVAEARFDALLESAMKQRGLNEGLKR